jgi:hypothetical protein
MKDVLKQIAEQYKADARARGLLVFPDAPRLETVAVWQGDWNSYLDFAIEAQARILYLLSLEYSVEDAIEDACREVGCVGGPILPNHFSARQLLSERIRERLSDAEQYEGLTASFSAWWICNGVAHAYTEFADWCDEYEENIVSIAEELWPEVQEERKDEKAEVSKRLYEYAEQMARHERFAEAKSEEKRKYMARQLFPDEEEISHGRIAEIASLFHWWYIEPGERVSKAEKACALYQKGESYKSIAIFLNMSEAAVKKAIETNKVY